MRSRFAVLLGVATLTAASALAAHAQTRRQLAFVNTEPYAAKQWYLTEDQAWSFWPSRPTLAPVKVAVIDSGIDAGHPEFIGRIAGGRSFVGGSWKRDTDGHGTFVAGEIAANPSNNIGIAGMAFNARLLIAKGRRSKNRLGVDRRRGEGDPLGRQQRRAGDQPESRRRP